MFEYHHTKQEIYMWAQAGCSLCKMFITAAFGKPNKIDYEVLESTTKPDENLPFLIVFSNRDKDTSLQMWKGHVDGATELLCQFEIYCTRCE